MDMNSFYSISKEKAKLAAAEEEFKQINNHGVKSQGGGLLENCKVSFINQLEYSKNMFTLNPYQELLYDENLETVYYL